MIVQPLLNHTEICRALNAVIRDMSVEEIKRDFTIKGTPANLMMRLLRVYHGAERRAELFGCIGVGCITFAEHRVQTFQRRTLRWAREAQRRRAASRQIGQLMREGEEVFYAFVGGEYREGAALKLVDLLLKGTQS